MNCHFPGLIVAEVLSCSCLDSTQGKMIMQDRLEKERNDAKNNVEEYVYDMRDKLHGMLEKFVSESVSKPSLVFFFFHYDIWVYLSWCHVCLFYLSELIGAVSMCHAGPRCFITKTGGYWKLAVWRRRGPTQTGVHRQTGRVKGNITVYLQGIVAVSSVTDMYISPAPESGTAHHGEIHGGWREA